MAKNSEIKILVETDENNIPDKIEWEATDQADRKEAKAAFLTLWDGKSALRIDLWNKEMGVDEMKQFVHQTMITMADTLERATGEAELVTAMRKFSEAFAERIY